ncbi:zinc finger CCHC domain-containing protein 4 [Tetranychus urticae]|uniref:CTCHY-type domain-containing protein n=1 Tax=Tetranychus urticae TaxID=32264 RepID=T1KZ30_TETUR|nr:zinc finger CCHC domain-containing protein 4 [Tetranychus urticae]
MESPTFQKFANKSMGLDVIFDECVKKPNCKHGPTLLLSKKVGNSTKKFFACSAYRDNKCPLLKNPLDTSKFVVQRKKIRKKLVKVFQARKEERAYCRRCEELFLYRDYHKHQRHDVIDKIPLKLIRRPTLLLQAATKRKKEAQYFFDNITVNFIIQTFQKLELNRIICIGCPSIHEQVQSNKRSWNMESVLLDIDPRYCQFYLRKHFIMFNMFNGFFFEGNEGQSKLDRFLRECEPGRACVVIDPPFGGLLKALGRSLDQIHDRYLELHGHPGTTGSTAVKLNRDSYQFAVMLFLPYFNEPKVAQYMKNLKLTDYKVHYTNHRALKDCRCRSSLGSIVRIFTNIQPYVFTLPTEEGYKYCEICKRYVSENNSHCEECDACTSKDGRPPKHCNICKKCVKNTWFHCFSCKICRLPGTCKHPQRKNNKNS